MVPLPRVVTVLPWWVRPRAAMRFHAPVSRSPCHLQPGPQGPLPARDGGPVGGLAVPEWCEALRAVFGGVAGRDGDHRDARFGGEVPYPVGDLPAYHLGQAGVHGAAHTACFHRPQVFEVDDTRPSGDGLIHCPPCARPRECIVEVRPSVGHGLDLIGQDCLLPVQRVLLGLAGEPLVAVGFRVQTLAKAAEAVLFGEDTGSTEHSTRAEGGDGAVLVETGSPGTEQGGQAPVHTERDGMPSAGGLGNGVGVGEIRSHATSTDPQVGQVQNGRGRNRRRKRDRAGHPCPVLVRPRIGLGRQLQPQQNPARIVIVPFDGGLLPVTRR